MYPPYNILHNYFTILQIPCVSPFHLSPEPLATSDLFPVSLQLCFFQDVYLDIQYIFTFSLSDIFTLWLNYVSLYQWFQTGDNLDWKGQLAMCGSISSCHNCRRQGICCVVAKDAVATLHAQENSSQEKIIQPKCHKCPGWETLIFRNFKKNLV